MNQVCFYDTKPYDKIYFEELKKNYNIQIDYFESKLGPNGKTGAGIRSGCGICQ